MNQAQQAAWYYSRRRRRAKNAPASVFTEPRSGTHAAGVTASDLVVAGVTVVDGGVGVSVVSLSGPDAADFSIVDGMNLTLVSGAHLSQGVSKVVSVDVSNTVKGDASHVFTLQVT